MPQALRTDAPPGTDSPGDTGASGGPEAPGDTATPQAEITTVNRGPSEAGKFIVEQRVRQKAENEFERRREEFNAGRREVSLCPLCGPSAPYQEFSKLKTIVREFAEFQRIGKNPPLNVLYGQAKRAKTLLKKMIDRDREGRYARNWACRTSFGC